MDSDNVTSSTAKEVVIVSGKEVQETKREPPHTKDLVEDSSLLGDEDITELFNHLRTADDVAQEMEQKLDAILENLDKLLDVLDPEGTSGPPTTKK
jgi:hypothetical protein